MYEQEIEAIKEFFSCKFLHAVPGWIEGCAEFFVSNNNNYSCNQLQDFAFEQWKLADLREMGSGCLPPNLSTTLKTVLPGKYAIQIEWIRDIGHASYAQFRKIRQSNNPNEDVGSTKPQSWEPRQSRMIQIRISDGLQSIQAIEYRRVSAFDQSLCPGTKALISGPVECRRGMLLLEEHNIQIIGGEVDSLIISNAPENILARVLGLAINPNPSISFNPGNEGETQDEENGSTATQQAPSSNAARLMQQGSVSSSIRTMQQILAPSTIGSIPPATTSQNARQMPPPSSTRSIPPATTSQNVRQMPPPSSTRSIPPATTTRSILPATTSQNVRQMPPPSSTRTMGPPHKASRSVQQVPLPSTVRTVSEPKQLPSRSVKNGDRDFSRTTVDNSDDLLNDEEILGEDMLAHLSALENEYLSEKEPPELVGAFHDKDIIEEPSNIDDEILLNIPDVHIVEEKFKASNSSASVGDKSRKKVTFGAMQQKSPAASQKKITNYINKTPVKQQPSTSSGKTNYMLHTDESKIEDFKIKDSALDSEFTTDIQEPYCSILNKASTSSEPHPEISTKNSKELFSDYTSNTSIITSSSPFVYLKQIKTDLNIPKTYRAKVFILTLISELELKGDEWLLYAKVCDGTANLDVQLSSSVMEKLLNLPKEMLLKWKPHIQTNKDIREELKMRMKTAEHRLIHFNNLVDIKVEPGKKMPCITAIYEMTSEDMQALKLRLAYIRENCVPKT